MKAKRMKKNYFKIYGEILIINIIYPTILDTGEI